jgi:hypothetical protein
MVHQYQMFVLQDDGSGAWLRPKYAVRPFALNGEVLDTLMLLAGGTLYFHNYTQVAFTLRDKDGNFVLSCDKDGNRLTEVEFFTMGKKQIGMDYNYEENDNA